MSDRLVPVQMRSELTHFISDERRKPIMPRRGTITHYFPCPTCGGEMSSGEASKVTRTKNLAVYLDVPCHACGVWYTLEVRRNAETEAEV